MRRIAAGLWSWSCRHPEWHPGTRPGREAEGAGSSFGAEVVSFAARTGDAFLLIDPLLPEDESRKEVLKLLDREAATKPAAILITIPYHVRSAAELAERYEGTSIHGHRACAKRFGGAALAAFKAIEPDAELPGGARAFAIGKPRRYEMPIHLPSHDAIVFGDAIVGVEGGLRMWATEKIDAKQRRFYDERFAPTLEPLIGLGAERVLVTHGASVLSGGGTALREAAGSAPWYHRG